MKFSLRSSVSLIRICGLALSLLPIARAQFAGGSGTPADPYQIATPAQLDAVRGNLGAAYVLAADIDLTGIALAPITDDNGTPFTGRFNGAGHSISHWSFDDSTQNAGLFATIDTPGQVANLRLIDCHITHCAYAAGLLAAGSSGSVENCTATGSIAGAGRNASVGGLIGYGGNVVGCCTDVSIVAPASDYMGGACGGLAGYAFGEIRDCHASGAISSPPGEYPTSVGGLLGISSAMVQRCFATGRVEGGTYVGGLVGHQYDYSAISKCYATGDIVAAGNYAIGGLIGLAQGFVGDSYARGSVSSTAESGETGGLIGYVGASPWDGTVLRCYAAGPVLPLGAFNARGFIANTSGEPITADCFWDVDTTGSSWTFLDLGASFDIHATGLHTAQMQDPATYAAWDSTRVWTLLAGQYPLLRPDGLLLATITTQPLDQSVVAGANVQFTVAANGSGPFTVQWDHDGALLPGATNTTLTLPNVQSADTGGYRATVWNSVGPAFSYVAYLDVTAPPTPPQITSDPESQVALAGANVTFWVIADDGRLPLSYQWTKDGAPIAGATDSMLALNAVSISDSASYSVLVSNDLGSVASTAATLTVYSFFPVITTAPTGAVLNVGESYTLSVQAAGMPPLQYQWFKDGYYITGATSASYTIANANAADAGNYLVYVTSPASGAPYGVNSSAAPISLRVPPTLTALSLYPTVDSLGQQVTLYGSFQPATEILWNGAPIDFPYSGYVDPVTMVMHVPPSQLAAADFQVVSIAVRNPGGSVSASLPLTLKSSNVTSVQVTTAPPSGSTTVVATSAQTSDPVGVSATLQNNGTSDATIAVATYNQLPTSTPAIQVGGQYVDVLVANAQPADVATVQFYYPASITGSAETDVALSYFDGMAWQPVSSSGGAAPVKNTTDNLDNTHSGGRFTVVFDATSTPKITELTGTVFTAGPKLKKNAAKEKATIVTQPADAKVHAGDAFSLTVVATSATNCTYQWFRDGKKTPIAGATSATLAFPSFSATDADAYYVVITNASGSVTSKKAILTLVPAAPAIGADPQSLIVSSGASATFTTTATGEGTLSYQWQFNGKAIPGANKASYSIANVTQANAGSYTVVVSNAGGSTTSGAATLTVNSPSISSLNPTTVVSGGAAFTLTVSGSNFVNGDVVRWAGDDLATTFVDANTLKASVPKNELTPTKTAKSVAITVRAPGGDASNAATLTVTAK